MVLPPRVTVWLAGEAATVKSGPALTVSVYTWLAVSEILSVTVAVTVKLPALFGVPEIVPVAEPIESPAGNPLAEKV